MFFKIIAIFFGSARLIVVLDSVITYYVSCLLSLMLGLIGSIFRRIKAILWLI